MEAAEVGRGLDDPMSHACYLGTRGDIGHSPAVSTGRITPEISFELISQAVFRETHGNGGQLMGYEPMLSPCLLQRDVSIVSDNS